MWLPKADPCYIETWGKHAGGVRMLKFLSSQNCHRRLIHISYVKALDVGGNLCFPHCVVEIALFGQVLIMGAMCGWK